MPRSNIAFRFPRTNRQDCTDFTLTFDPFTKLEVLGGASEALDRRRNREGHPDLAGLPERVLDIRDQNLLNPQAVPTTNAGKSLPPVVLDADGDVTNTETRDRQACRGSDSEFRSRSVSDYSTRDDHDETGRAAALACATCRQLPTESAIAV